MKYVLLDIEAIGIDISSGHIPAYWQTIFTNAGCAGHVPLEQYGNVMVLHDCDVALLNVAENSVVYQTDSDTDWQVWLEVNMVQVEE